MSGEGLTPEQRTEKINTAVADLEPDLTPQKKIDKELQARVTAINDYESQGFHLGNQLKNTISGPTWNSDTIALLKQINPDNVAYVIRFYPSLAKDVDEEWGLDFSHVKEYIVKPLIAKMDELGIEYAPVSENTDLPAWIEQAAGSIREANEETREKSEKNIQEVEDEKVFLDKFKKDAKPILDAANKTLADFAYADPKPIIVTSEDGKTHTAVLLPEGRRVVIELNDDGDIISIKIDKDPGRIGADPDPDVEYLGSGVRVAGQVLATTRYDQNKLVELVKMIFASVLEPAAEEEAPQE